MGPKIEEVPPRNRHIFLGYLKLSQGRQGIGFQFMNTANHGFSIELRSIENRGVSLASKIVLFTLDVTIALPEDLLEGGHQERSASKGFLGLGSERSQHGGKCVHKGAIGTRRTLTDHNIRDVGRKDVPVPSPVLPIAARIMVLVLGVKIKVVTKIVERQDGCAIRLG